MAQLPLSVKIVVLVLLFSSSNASPIKPLSPPQEDLSIGKAKLEKTSVDSAKVLPVNNVITDANKLKDKKLFGLDESPLVKLKGYKLISKDGGKSNIMKILFPKKQLTEKLSSNVNKAEKTIDEQIISTIQNTDAKDFDKNFVEVDDILLVRDPMDINLGANNDVSENDYVTTESSDSSYMDTTEKALKDMTLAERLKIAAKRRMQQKMTKLELTLHRELFKREDVPSDKSKTNDESTDKVESTTEQVLETVVEKQDEVRVASETEAPKLSADNGELISATLGIRKEDSEAVTESVAVENPQKSQSTSKTPQRSVPNEGETVSATFDAEKEDARKEGAATEIETDSSKQDQVGSALDNADIEDAVVGAAVPTATEPAIETVQEVSTEKLKPLDPEQALQATVEDTDGKSANEEEAVLGSPLELPNEDVQPATTESLKESTIDKPDESQVKSETDASKPVENEGETVSAVLVPKQEDVHSATERVRETVAGSQSTSDAPQEVDVKPENADVVQATSDVEGDMLGSSLQVPGANSESTATEPTKDAENVRAGVVDSKDGNQPAELSKPENNDGEVVSAILEPTKDDVQPSTESAQESVAEKTDEIPSTDSVKDDTKQEEAQKIDGSETTKSENTDVTVGAAQPSNSDTLKVSTGTAKPIDPVKEEEVSQAPSEPTDNKTETKAEEPTVGASSRSSSSSSSNSSSRNSNQSSSSETDENNESENSNSRSNQNRSSSSSSSSSQRDRPDVLDSDTNASNSRSSSSSSSSRSNSSSNNRQQNSNSGRSSSRSSSQSSSTSENARNDSEPCDDQNEAVENNESENSNSRSSTSGNRSSSSSSQRDRPNVLDSDTDASRSNFRSSNSQNQSSSSGNRSSSSSSSRSGSSASSNSNSNNNSNNDSANSRSSSRSSSSSSNSRIDELLAKVLANQDTRHPLLRRILLGASERAAESVRQRDGGRQSPQLQLPQLPLFKPGLFATPLISLFQSQAPLRRKKHVIRKRQVNEGEEEILTPKPFEPFEPPCTTKRPRLIERYRAMSSGEKAEKISKVLEKMMHVVTIAGHVDGYLTNRAKHSIKKLHKLFATSEETN
ncbi:serine-rich adhesin for platelets-like [Sitodiplosis mosellana]|uniref:serine-rich adhesin for platelets-like n=1 Tax=Sitodiplosis mosellana TaxID=263140 RepID=UPI002444D2C2|nr:serine-rich adhesin for platelets-like [Sitodiplosis mosellana]